MTTNLSGEPTLGAADFDGRELVASEYFALCHRRTLLVKGALDHWNATCSRTSTGRPVDAIICPVAASPPGPHGKNDIWGGYMSFVNVCDYTASVFPVSAVDAEKDVRLAEHAFRGDRDKQAYDDCEW